MSNQFILCNRGAGNFSMRFYQTLAAGRIPVLVNTDIILPFADFINWKDFIIIEQNEKKCLRSVIKVFNSKKSLQMQTKCAQVYHQFLSKTVYTTHLLRHLMSLNKIHN